MYGLRSGWNFVGVPGDLSYRLWTSAHVIWNLWLSLCNYAYIDG